MTPQTAKAIVLNLGDGITTSLSYLLPMVLFGGRFNGKSLIIGGLGGATSMAFNLHDSENGEGTLGQFVAAFTSAALGFLLPVLPFVLLPEPFAGLVSTLVVLAGVWTIAKVKAPFVGRRVALEQTLKSVGPAVVIVTVLSMI